MMKQPSFAQFITLINFDNDTSVLCNQLISTEHQVTALHQKKEILDNDIVSKSNEVKKLKISIKNQESYIKSRHELQKSKEKLLERVFSGREYTSLVNEIDTLKKEQSSLEPTLENDWQRLEDMEHECTSLTAILETQNSSVEQDLQALTLEEQQLKNLLENRIMLRNDLVATCPPDLIEQYNALRTKMNSPIVPVHNNACSYCLRVMPPQKLNNMQLNILEQCKNCFRLLYDPRFL